MTVQRRKDTSTPRVFMHKIADIRGGVSVATADLGGDFLPEGSVISAPVSGICHVLKIAVVSAAVAADATTVTVKKGHNLSVGDTVETSDGGTSVAITAIDTSAKDSDTITLGATLGAIAIGGYLVQTSKAATKGALKYTPFAVVGTGKPVISGQNIDTDAWVIGVTKGNAIPDFVLSQLKGIVNY